MVKSVMKILSVILVLLLSGPGTLRAEASKATALPNVNTYEELITAIRRVRAERQWNGSVSGRPGRPAGSLTSTSSIIKSALNTANK